ncbi:MAG: lipid droplet-associated protein [Haloechinothrix sp.]
MKSIPLPLRLAAGLAVSAAERARDLPRQLTGLPITVASQLLQFSMRVQQQVTELAIKGDDALSGLYPVEETPSWATFDEDASFDEESFGNDPRYDSPFDHAAAQATTDFALPEPRVSSNGRHPDDFTGEVAEETADSDPWAEEERALAELPADDEPEPTRPEQASAPSWLPKYAELTLPQLRARLRTFTEDQLTELLEHERATTDRSSFTGMLSRRIDNVRKQSEPDQTS